MMRKMNFHAIRKLIEFETRDSSGLPGWSFQLGDPNFRLVEFNATLTY